MTREQSIIWAAGFLEGEGYFERGKWRMGAAQVNREPLDRLKDVFGGNIYPRKRNPEIQRDWWGWELNGEDRVVAATAELLPYLSEDRKQRIPWLENALRYVQPLSLLSPNPTPPEAEMEGSEERFRLFRLCPCENCDGTGKTEVSMFTPARPSLVKIVRCKVCRGEGRELVEVATCGSPEAVGVALVTLGREGEWKDCPVGLLDSEGEKGQKWLVLPWDRSPSARNISAAGKVLRSARQQ